MRTVHSRGKLRNWRHAVRPLDARLAPAVLLHSLLPDDVGPQPDARFGGMVALGATYRVVGAPDATVAGFATVGQAFVYSATNNSLIATLNNPEPAPDDNFGARVAVSGKYVVVAAHVDDAGATNSGTVYVYDMTSATPTVPALKISNPSPGNSDFFGFGLAAEGNFVAVGAYQDDTGAPNAGSVYIFNLTSPTPGVPTITINNPSPATNESFGISVAAAGKYLAVGANRVGAGAAYIYDLTSATPTVPVASIDNPAPQADDEFGISIGMSGTIVVVGAFEDNAGATDAGSAYVYDIASATPTVPLVSLNNPFPDEDDKFGVSVAAAGKYVVVGAHLDDKLATSAGETYVYDVTSPTPTVPTFTLQHPATAGANFGFSVAALGKFVSVGAQYETTAGLTAAGAAFLYDLTSATPTVATASFNNPTPPMEDRFGTAVAATWDPLESTCRHASLSIL